MQLMGCAAIVTGSSSITGIGAETVKLLASKGCNVVINYATNEQGAAETVAACTAHGADAFAFQADVSTDEECRAMVKAAVERWGHLNVLVNNAAVVNVSSIGAWRRTARS